MSPSIAVIIPVSNGLRFLPGALACVKAQLYSPIELLIVDDGSKDGSLQYARDAGVRTLQTGGVGPAAARNAGIRATISDFVAFLDVDDLWPEGTLRLLSSALAANPDAGFAQGLIQNFRVREDGLKRFFTRPYRFLNLGASLYRRTLFDTIGLLDETMRLCEDLDFLMRCWEKDVPKVAVNNVTLFYRRHPGSMTSGLEGAGLGTVQAFKRRIDRIRQHQYDPNERRQVPAQEYMGTGPGKQDEEVAP